MEENKNIDKILAGNFVNRKVLESHVRFVYGLTPEIKSNVVISGSNEELKRLQLKDGLVFWGIVCETSDGKEEKKKQEDIKVVDRGKRHPSGINGNLKKPEKNINKVNKKK